MGHEPPLVFRLPGGNLQDQLAHQGSARLPAQRPYNSRNLSN